MKILSLIFLSLLCLSACSSDVLTPAPLSEQSEKVILALGDSLTAGYGLPESDSYPSQLERVLRSKSYNYRIINAGISGDTSAGLLARMDWVLGGVSPTLAILCIGANDAFQGKAVEDIERNIRAIIELLQSKNIPILFAGMKAPLNLGGGYGRTYEAIFPKLAKEYDLVYMDFFLAGVALKGSLNQEDRIHPTASGYAVVVENLLEILENENLIAK